MVVAKCPAENLNWHQTPHARVLLKQKLQKVKVTQSCLTLCDPMDYTVPGILQARILGVGSLSLLQGIFPIQRSNPDLPALQADSLPAESQGKPKNTGVGSLSLLQQIFQTQESNWGLPQWRQSLYQLSHQGSPKVTEWQANAGTW